MPSGFAMSMIAFVIWMSACEGEGSLEGWLWTMDRAIYHVDSVGVVTAYARTGLAHWGR
jgi:hypothetical protein